MSAHPPARTRASAARSVLGLLGVALPLLIGAAGCSAGPGAAPLAAPKTTVAAETPASAAGGGQPASEPGTSPAAPAVQARDRVQTALDELVRTAPQPSREQIRSALGAAGFDPGLVEVSASRTPTGLNVEAVEAGVPSGGLCVMAQVRSGTAVATVLPALPNGRCFVGTANG